MLFAEIKSERARTEMNGADGKKDKAKGNRQKEAKQAKAAKQNQDKQQPPPPVPDQRK